MLNGEDAEYLLASGGKKARSFILAVAVELRFLVPHQYGENYGEKITVRLAVHSY